MSKIQSLINDIIDTISKTKSVEKIMLFGSRARGDEDERSDVDIAVVCPDASLKEWLNICERIEAVDTLLEIDVVRFDESSDELKEKILKEGKLLYERN